MKNQMRLFETIAIAVLAAAVLGACAPVLGTSDDPVANEAARSLTVGIKAPSSTARTLIPDMSTAVQDYEIMLTRSSSDPNAASYAMLSSGMVPAAPYTFSAVPVGDWDVDVTGYDSGGQPIVAGSATNVPVTDPGGGSAMIDVLPQQVGTGTLSLSYTFPPYEIDAVVLTLDDGVSPVYPSVTVDSAGGTATYSAPHASGFYELTAEFQLAGQTRAVTIESVHMYDYQETVHTLSLSIAQLGAPPSVPAVLTVTELSPGTVELTWDDTSQYETGFVVERSTNAFATVETSINAGANEERMVMTGLFPGVLYYFRVFAENDFGASSHLTGDIATAAQPSVLATNPADGATGVPVTESLIIEFNTPMDQAASAPHVSVSHGPYAVPTTASWLTGTQLQLDPVGGAWPVAYADYTLRVGEDVRSSGGRPAGGDAVISFATAGPVGEADPGFATSGRLLIDNVLNPTNPETDTAIGLTVGQDGTLYVAGTTYADYLMNYGAYVFAIDPTTGGPAYEFNLVYAEVSGTGGEHMWGKDVVIDRYGNLVVATEFSTLGAGHFEPTLLSRDPLGQDRRIFAGGSSRMDIVSMATATTTDAATFSRTHDAVFTVATVDWGGSNDAAIIKHLFAGPDDAAVDPGFGTSGVSVLNRSAIDQLLDIAVDENTGAVYAAGRTVGGGDDLWVVSIDPLSGALDTGFAGSGEVVIDENGTGEISGGTSVALDTAGNILVGGYVDATSSSRSAVWRLTDAGSLDPAFNAAATNTSYAGGMIYDAGGPNAIQELVVHPMDQNIYAAGTINGIDTDGFLIKVR